MVSLTTNCVLDLIKYNHLHLVTSKICMSTAFPKDFIDPI